MNLQYLRHDIHTRPKHLRQQNQEHALIPQPEHPQSRQPRFAGPRCRREGIFLFLVRWYGSRLVLV